MGLFKISSLNQAIESLNNQIHILMEQNNNLRNNILSSVDSKLEEYSNTLVSAYYNYGEFNADSLDVKVMIEALPKTYNVAVTKVYLVDTNGKEYLLNYDSAKYIGEITLPLLEEIYIDCIVLDNNGNLTNQALNWRISPADKVLPHIEINSYSNINIKHKDSYQVSFNGDVRAHIYMEYSDEKLDLKAADAVVELGNNEIDRIPFKANATDNMITLDLPSINKKYDINIGENLYFYVDIQNGDFTIRRLIDMVSIGEDGKRIKDNSLDDYINKNIRVKFKEQIIYDISEELTK